MAKLAARGPFVKARPWLTGGACVGSVPKFPHFLCFQRRSYLINALVRRPFPALVGFDMSKPPPAPSTLAELRKEIDAIDEQVHRLLMARGDIIDRLIQVKQTQEVGSAFRPAREASMMRQLVERHRGILPLDTIESIWRVIISTLP